MLLQLCGCNLSLSSLSWNRACRNVGDLLSLCFWGLTTRNPGSGSYGAARYWVKTEKCNPSGVFCSSENCRIHYRLHHNSGASERDRCSLEPLCPYPQTKLSKYSTEQRWFLFWPFCSNGSLLSKGGDYGDSWGFQFLLVWRCIFLFSHRRSVSNEN